MPMKRRAGQRKLRTREHVLADLSINHVERQILRRGFAVDRTDKTDYGIDLVMCTYAENGAVENGDVWFQVKATDHPELIGSRKSIRVRIEMAHLRHWLWEPRPVALVLYDGTADRAYWICVQKSLSRDGLSDSDDESAEGSHRAFKHPRADVILMFSTLRSPQERLLQADAVSVRRHLDEAGLLDARTFDRFIRAGSMRLRRDR